MKKLFTIFSILCIVHCVFSQGKMDIYGVMRQIDTIEYKQVGPGTMYCYARMPELPQEFHVLTIDLENQYAEIETFLGKDCIAGTELVTSACNGISLTVTVDGESPATSTVSSITGHTLARNTGEEITVVISYDQNSATADGDFTVTLPSITLNYASAD